MILIWALTLVGSAVIGNSGNSNNGEETTEQHEARVRRELAEASAIQNCVVYVRVLFIQMWV